MCQNIRKGKAKIIQQPKSHPKECGGENSEIMMASRWQRWRHVNRIYWFCLFYPQSTNFCQILCRTHNPPVFWPRLVLFACILNYVARGGGDNLKHPRVRQEHTLSAAIYTGGEQMRWLENKWVSGRSWIGGIYLPWQTHAWTEQQAAPLTAFIYQCLWNGWRVWSFCSSSDVGNTVGTRGNVWDGDQGHL